MPEERFLTPGEVRLIMDRAHEIARVYVEAADVYDALYDFTVQPGDPGYCEGCEWWDGHERFGNQCAHDDFDGEHCPIGRYDAP